MPVIPWPASVQKDPHTAEPYVFSGPITVCYSGHGAQEIANRLCQYLDLSLGLNSLAESQDDSDSSKGLGSIVLRCRAGKRDLELLPNSNEGYKLLITETQVIIEALGAHGLFNGVQTLIQQLPPKPSSEIRLSGCEIIDSPRFPWRGVLIDVGRHFFSINFLKKILDVMAFYKMNRLHWHLTEDQGWRIEIKKYPRLTEFGAWRGPQGRQYGGFYTQEQVKEIVAYAAERFIEIIPEIELPGHCCAALACYPELSCTGQPRQVPDFWGIQEDVYCAGNDAALDFLKDVFEEVFELFPSKYIHIGGDECPKVRWSNCDKCQKRIAKEKLADEFALQSWFIGQFSSFLKQHGKQLIGWDEILEGGLHDGSMVMSWRGIIGGVRAAKEGHHVIMTPTSHCYFDYRQSLRADEPGAWFAMLPLEMVYDFDPIPPRPDFSHTNTQKTFQPPLSSSSNEIGGIDIEIDVEVGPREEAEDTANGISEGRPEDDVDSHEAFMDGVERSDSRSSAGAEVVENDLDGMSDMAVEEEEHEQHTPREPSLMSQASSAEDHMEPVVYSSSVANIYRHRPQHDWTLDAKLSSLIVGGQANLWTEYISDEDTVEYMLFPRLCAMSEALWSPVHERNWPNFMARLRRNIPHLEARNLKYRPID